MVSITQKQYIEHVLHKENMEYANPVATPLDHNILIIPNDVPSDQNQSNPFAHLLRELQYIANKTCPNISYPVNWLASYTANPSIAHYGMIKRILRYLTGTKDYAITYKKWAYNP
jgi:hypothetical protein